MYSFTISGRTYLLMDFVCVEDAVHFLNITHYFLYEQRLRLRGSYSDCNETPGFPVASLDAKAWVPRPTYLDCPAQLPIIANSMHARICRRQPGYPSLVTEATVPRIRQGTKPGYQSPRYLDCRGICRRQPGYLRLSPST